MPTGDPSVFGYLTDTGMIPPNGTEKGLKIVSTETFKQELENLLSKHRAKLEWGQFRINGTTIILESQ
jgi:hypothetical protein